MSYKRSNAYHRDSWRDRSGDRSHYSRDRNGSSQRRQDDTRGRDSLLTDDESRLVYQGRQELFHKKKHFPRVSSLKDNSLLLAENIFAADRWDVDALLEQKKRLDATRNRLDEKDIKVLRQHMRKTNMTGQIVWSLREQNQIEMCTNAWIKLAEIFSRYEQLMPADLPKDQPYRTVHVCEAPGAFICTTNFYFQRRYNETNRGSSERQWEWIGLSLNPYYEGNDQEAMVDDDRFIVETLDRWYFGVDNSGNILEPENIRGLWDKVRTNPTATGVDLVTGDGAVDTSSDPNEQESIIVELHYAEVVYALGALKWGGSFVLKMFNLFECESVCLLYLLALYFHELSIFKPASSRAPNAETFLIATGFRGIAPDILNSLLSFVSPTFPQGKVLLSRESIPQSFIDSLIDISDYFTTMQIQALERDLNLEKAWNRNIQQAVWQLNQDVAREFRRVCSIDSRYVQRVRIVTDVELDGSAKALGNSAAVVKGGLRERPSGTLEDRQSKKRDRDEFLSGSKNSDGTDVKDEGEEESPKKKRSSGSGSNAMVGQTDSVTCPTSSTIAMEIDSAGIEQQQEPAPESKAMKMMKKSGFVEGQGLGAHGQGRAIPVDTVVRDTRLGLGHHEQPSIELLSSSSSGVPSVADEPLFANFDQPISAHSRVSTPFSSLDHRSITIASSLQSVLTSLFVKFEDLESLYKKREEYSRNKTGTEAKIFLSDQLETLNQGGEYEEKLGVYVDYRAAFQLASLDKIFKLTSLSSNDSSPLSFIVESIGFAEYLSWQQRGHVNGLVISDFPSPFPANSSIVIGKEIDPAHPKVHLFFSDLTPSPIDPGFNGRYTERTTKRRLLVSCRNALTMLVNGGHFICKLSDIFTRFTAGLIYLLYRSFASIVIIRPFTVDPASADRFLVCRELRYPINPNIIEHLDRLLSMKDEENILEVVPLKCLLESQFQQYLAHTAQRLLQREVQALKKRLWYNGHGNEQKVDPILKQQDWTEARQCTTVQRRLTPLLVQFDSSVPLPLL